MELQVTVRGQEVEERTERRTSEEQHAHRSSRELAPRAAREGPPTYEHEREVAGEEVARRRGAEGERGGGEVSASADGSPREADREWEQPHRPELRPNAVALPGVAR